MALYQLTIMSCTHVWVCAPRQAHNSGPRDRQLLSPSTYLLWKTAPVVPHQHMRVHTTHLMHAFEFLWNAHHTSTDWFHMRITLRRNGSVPMHVSGSACASHTRQTGSACTSHCEETAPLRGDGSACMSLVHAYQWLCMHITHLSHTLAALGAPAVMAPLTHSCLLRVPPQASTVLR